MTWSVYEAQGAHVVPDADVVEHQLTDECVCGPRIAPVFRELGDNGWLIVHHSLDGRELTEA